MRTYPQNSPQAAARIATLTLLADGNLSKVELDTLERLHVHERLGLSRPEFENVVHAFCNDLLFSAQLTWADTCRVDPRTLAQLMAEIDDPALRLQLLRLCISIAEADSHIAEAESIVLEAAVEHWGLHRAMLLPEPARPGLQPQA
jgi:uncharacterized tellurite resistance protein B-like protein